MSRTADRSGAPRSRAVLLVLLVLIGCLSAHFLVEDLVFLASHPDMDATANGIEELTHCDDLALVVTIPVARPVDRVSFVPPVALPAQTQQSAPLLRPPKI